MEVIKIVFFIAVTMALSITLTMKLSIAGHGHVQEASNEQDVHENVLVPTKRVSRFLAQEYKNPRAADLCNKDYEECSVQGQNATTCCNNKCVDVHYDNNNCGACKKKCKYTETCCRGQCVNTEYDKRHCGSCNNKCKTGDYCLYGMCEYA